MHRLFIWRGKARKYHLLNSHLQCHIAETASSSGRLSVSNCHILSRTRRCCRWSPRGDICPGRAQLLNVPLSAPEQLKWSAPALNGSRLRVHPKGNTTCRRAVVLAPRVYLHLEQQFYVGSMHGCLRRSESHSSLGIFETFHISWWFHRKWHHAEEETWLRERPPSYTSTIRIDSCLVTAIIGCPLPTTVSWIIRILGYMHYLHRRTCGFPAILVRGRCCIFMLKHARLRIRPPLLQSGVR